jgi:hypothetical protein
VHAKQGVLNYASMIGSQAKHDAPAWKEKREKFGSAQRLA